MNIMKLTDIKSTILIILLMCICFFIQTYYEIEYLDVENTPDTNKEYIDGNTNNVNLLSASTNNANAITQLKKDIEELKTSLNTKINANTERLDKAQIKLTNLLSSTNPE